MRHRRDDEIDLHLRLPATGGLSDAGELAAPTGYNLFHNHHAVDLLVPVFEFVSSKFVELCGQTSLWIFGHIVGEGFSIGECSIRMCGRLADPPTLTAAGNPP